MKLGVLRETKNPPDRRVPLSPKQCAEVKKQYPNVEILVQPGGLRAFSDEEYEKEGVAVVRDVSDCNVLIGVKEVDVPCESRKWD